MKAAKDEEVKDTVGSEVKSMLLNGMRSERLRDLKNPILLNQPEIC